MKTNAGLFNKMRSLSYSMIKDIINNDYEDECYELVYNLDPIALELAKETGIVNETQILKLMMKDKNIYNITHTYNEKIKQTKNEFYNMQMMFYVIEYINATNGIFNYMRQANELINSSAV
jgi:2-keto-4-pentenoate hydratase/2-oxohepta-3-ene-1,7-dioic acid hydratase in catechol pathway